MKSRHLLISLFSTLILSIISNHSKSQFLYDFQDPSISFQDLAISGDTSLYIIEDGQLKLNASGSSSPAQLFLPSDVATKAVWEAHVEFDFNPSSSNYAEIFLMSDVDSSGLITNGYYIRIGGSEDDIRLYKIENDQKTILIDGPDKYLDLSSISLDISASRDSLGEWNVYSKLVPAEEFEFVGSAIDNALTHSSSFSLKCRYTSTRADKFRFDNIFIEGIPFPDIFPPQADSLILTGPDLILLEFNEPFSFDSGSFQIISPVHSNLHSTLISEEGLSIQVQFDTSFSNGFIHELVLKDISDESGNIMKTDTLTFLFFEPVEAVEKDIVLNEVFADYNPVEDLPEGEFIELLNISENPFDLSGWKLTDNRTQTDLGNFIILPDSFLILTSKALASDFDTYGKVMALDTWPTLNNEYDSLVLTDNTGKIIDAFIYHRSNHNEGKTQGGWSLELIDPHNQCKISSNWASSIDQTGGTPGKINSIFNDVPDTIPPSVMNLTNSGIDKIKIAFSEPVKAEEASFELNVQSLSNIINADNNMSEWIITVDSLLQSDISYELKIDHLNDCYNNELESNNYWISFDLDPPRLDSTYSIYHNQLELVFNENVDYSNLEIKSKDLDILIHVVADNPNPSHISLYIDSMFLSPFNGIFIFENLKDYNGNFSPYVEYLIDYIPPPIANKHDLIITELLSDPEPSAGLPEIEFIEIYNKSNIAFPLRGLKLSDLNNTGIVLDGYLEPGKYVILTKESAVNQYQEYGDVVGVSTWPNLNSSGDLISFINQKNDLIHSLEYNDSWYQSLIKKEGGWSLEMIDISNPCGEENNWIASENPLGGSPGKSNSVNASKPDLRGPKVLSVIIQSGDTIITTFNEKIDSGSVFVNSFELKPSFPIKNVVVADDEKQITIILSESLELSQEYHLFINGITDCNGNILPKNESFHTIILPEKPMPGDLVLNEILFNPRPGGVDFVEIVNKTNKNLDLNGVLIANEKDSSTSKIEFILGPFAYLALSPDPEILVNEYPLTKLGDVIKYKLPSLPDHEGNVFIYSLDSIIYDEFSYSEEMHFELLKYVEGVSLERISFDKPSNLDSNWTSASSTSSGATPGFQNTQNRQMISITTPISISPTVIDPTSGHSPFTTIQYSFDKAGYVGTLQIYSLQGNKIKELMNTEYLPQSGFVRWEGTNESGGKVPTGAYILYFQIFDLDGQIRTYKERVVVATQF